MKKVKSFLSYDITGTLTLIAFVIMIVMVLFNYYDLLAPLLSVSFMYLLKIMIVHYNYVKKVDNSLTDDLIRVKIFNLHPYSYHGTKKNHKTYFESNFDKIYVAVFVFFIVLTVFMLMCN